MYYFLRLITTELFKVFLDILGSLSILLNAKWRAGREQKHETGLELGESEELRGSAVLRLPEGTHGLSGMLMRPSALRTIPQSCGKLVSRLCSCYFLNVQASPADTTPAPHMPYKDTVSTWCLRGDQK